MSVVKMSKFSLYVSDKISRQLLKKLQKLDLVHFEDLTDEKDDNIDFFAKDDSVEYRDIQERIDRVEEAISILKNYQSTPKNFKQKLSNKNPEISWDKVYSEERSFSLENKLSSTFLEKSTYDILNNLSLKIEQKTESEKMHILVEEILSLNAQRISLSEEKKILSEKIKELDFYKDLDIDVRDLLKLKKTDIFIGSISKKWAETLKNKCSALLETHIEVIGEDAENKFVFLLCGKKDTNELEQYLREYGFSKYSFAGTGTPRQQLSIKNNELSELEKKYSIIENNLKDISHVLLNSLELSFEKLNNKIKRVDAKNISMSTEYVRHFEGYVPTKTEKDFKDIVHSFKDDVYLEIKEESRIDGDAPILLENNPIVSPFESIVRTYSLPQYTEFDPTPLLAPWYFLFFSMMISDMGYGLILALGSFLAMKIFKFKKETKETLKFFGILGVGATISGYLFGSVFSGAIKINPVLFDPTEKYMNLIILSLVIGVIHIAVALGIKAIHLTSRRKYIDMIADVITWYLALGGAMVFLGGGMLHVSPQNIEIAKWVMIIGMVGIVLLTARHAKGILGKIAGGMYNLYGITSYIGDIVSYTRIAALLLAGAYIGYAVNLICSMMPKNIIGLVIAGFIFVFFHLFNLFLSALSGYVHTMRLIYVEFFGKFFEGGGKPFKKFRAESKYIDIK